MPRFRDKDTEAYSQGKRVPKFTEIERPGVRRLKAVMEATSVMDLRNTSGNRFEAMRGNRQGEYSIRINDKWRICFRWDDDHSHTYDIRIEDYH